MKSSLKYYDEFKRVLSSYSMSERATKALEGLKLVLMVAPTSGGRNTIISHLVESKNYYFVVSDTTRQPQVRDGLMERTGVNYFFRTEEEMLADLKAGEFLEAALIHEQQVSGISIRELERAKLLYRTAITDVETIGADVIIKATPQAKAIFLVPPNFDIWQDRINSRGQMSHQELANRLNSAAIEFREALKHDYYNIVVADNVEHASAVIDDIVNDKPNIQQGRAIEAIHQIQYRLDQKLESLKFI